MLTLNPPPGTYGVPQTVTVTGPAGSSVMATTSGSDPVIVKTVAASSNFTPPKPYMQSIEDGRGRAIFDGSFPKYYNANISFLGTPTSTYLTNAFNFLARGGQGASGKSILFIGDQTVALGNYAIKGTRSSDFHDFLNLYAQRAGCTTITFQDVDDYGGMLNPTYEFLIQYDIIFLLSSHYSLDGSPQPPSITSTAATAIAEARKAGVGLYICTDHNVFFSTANAVISQITAAQFEGNYDLSPGTTVGYNKGLFGNSPLFVGLADTDVLIADSSNSSVQQTVVNPQALPITVQIPTGYTTVKFAVIDSAGNVTFEEYGYNVGQPPIVDLSDAAGNVLSQFPQTSLRSRTVHFFYHAGSGGLSGAASGYIKVAGVVVGTFDNISTAGVIQLDSWLDTQYSKAAQPNIVAVTGMDSPNVQVDLTSPIPFTFSWPFNRFIPDAPTVYSARWIQSMNRNEFALAGQPSPAKFLQNIESILGVRPTVGLSPIAKQLRAIYGLLTQ